MDFLIAAVTVLSLVTLTVYVMIRNRKKPVSRDNKLAFIPVLLLMNVCVVISGMFIKTSLASRLMLDLTVVVTPLLILSFSFNYITDYRPVFYVSAGVDAILFSLHLMCLARIFPPASPPVFAIFVTLLITGVSVYFFLCMLHHVRNISLVMKLKGVISVVYLFEDISYILAMMTYLAVFNYFCGADFGTGVILLLDALMLASICSLVYRMSKETVFTFMDSQETLIFESIKSSTIELNFDPVSEEDCNRIIYNRLTEYFENEQPYLNNELNINDVARAVCSNKTYVSKAISLCTGRNFRQFVNYYRIRHSILLFHENPSLKIVNIYCQCGFNSLAAFNMAFRLFMKENPSEWFRIERARLRNSLADKD